MEPARHAGTALLRSQTDARLVDLTRDGNERAFEAIVQRYHRSLLRYCSRILPVTRAEDAVQQAFLSAHRSIHAGDAELNLRPWLYRIAHNASLNQLRQSGFDHDEVSEEIDGVETPPQAFERGERLRSVMAAVHDLPERQRAAIVLQAMEGRTYEEIAEELGVSDGAVRQLLNRARNTLREAAAAVTPTGLLTRIASSGGDASVAERGAQVVAGSGGGALLAKAGATLVVAGAVAGGAATGTLPVPVIGHDDAPKAAAATERPAAAAGAVGGGGSAATSPGAVSHSRSGSATPRNGGGAGAKPSRPGDRRGGRSGGGGSGSPTRSGPGGNSGPGGGGLDGGGDHSGSGSSGSGDGGHSGSDGGGDHSGSGSSGSGSSGSDSSGPGSGASPRGRAGSGGSGSSGSDGGSSGSGSSGSGSSGSDSSGPGSGETVTTSSPSSGRDRSGSGSSGEGSGDSATTP